MPYEDITDSFRRLVRIMERLQEPDGCPWDLEQTHASLKPYMIEEAYEALDAIDRGDDVALAEELGDVLLQVVFHSVLAKRTGRFSIDDVSHAAATKMVRRHPHVFGEMEAKTAADVLHNWENLKAAERQQKAAAGATSSVDIESPSPSILAHVPRNLPSLLRAQRLQEKAARVGFDWPDAMGVLDKIEEEIRELREALRAQTQPADPKPEARNPEIVLELGDVLFSLVNLSRFLKLDAEECLRQTCNKFQARFEFIEANTHAQQRKLESLTLEEMDRLWNNAKEQLG
ncbi:MAG: nucleoside triphosphate pyrophosphohydrolase [Candidatus Sumerlaeaceae bacterium]